jgi:hypothetical protein
MSNDERAEASAALAAAERLGARYVTAADFEQELPGAGRSGA